MYIHCSSTLITLIVQNVLSDAISIANSKTYDYCDNIFSTLRLAQRAKQIKTKAQCSG